MKTRRMIVMFVALLTIGGAMTTLFTSCSSNEDSPATGSEQGPTAEELNGTWYCVYEATGSAKNEGGSDATVNYNLVIDIYRFESSQEGSFFRCFFNDDDESPVLVQGILGYGAFTYSSSNGKVSLALTNNFNQEYPQAWEVGYADNTLQAKGVDGQKIELIMADEEIELAINNMLDQNGGGDTEKYDVNNYKPKGVDHSQWMKQLADSRLVADLSLPASHDAVTAEGWTSDLMGIFFEMMAKTQDLTINEQLKIGMRVFDLRPEYLVGTSGNYELRCSHGFSQTKLLVSDFFVLLKQFLATNPTEFCIVTIDLSETYRMKEWSEEFSALISSDQFRSMFVDFKPRLTVGEMRGHVLLLSKKIYAEKPIGGYCYNWTDDIELEKQMKGHITGADGVKTPLWVQDYWGKATRDGKDDAVVRLLEAAVNRDMNAEKPAWVINFPSAYFGGPFSDNYRENAVSANKVTSEWLNTHNGSVGIIFMDFGGMDKSPSYTGLKLYETGGMQLVDMVIKQNFKQ